MVNFTPNLIHATRNVVVVNCNRRSRWLPETLEVLRSTRSSGDGLALRKQILRRDARWDGGRTMKDKLSTFGHLGNLFPVGERTLIYSGKIPLFAKIAVTAFLSVLLPVYLHTYGPTNFLWFCDAALIVTVGGMWLESSLLISMCAVGILVPQLLWLVDFFINLLGAHFLNLTGYMFDPQLSFFIRGLSLFHGWLPLLLIWLLHRVGYDTRALVGWSTLATGLVIVCYLFTPASGPHPASSNLPIDINYVYGFSDQRAQTLINQNLYVILWLGALWLGAYLPTHLILRKFFPASKPLVGLRLPLELL